MTATGATTVWRCCAPPISCTRHPRARASAAASQYRGQTEGITLAGMRAYVLGELGDRLAVDVSRAKKTPSTLSRRLRGTSPGWTGMLLVAPIELD